MFSTYWPQANAHSTAPVTLTKQQFDALVLGLPWQRLHTAGAARVVWALVRKIEPLGVFRGPFSGP